MLNCKHESSHSRTARRGCSRRWYFGECSMAGVDGASKASPLASVSQHIELDVYLRNIFARQDRHWWLGGRPGNVALVFSNATFWTGEVRRHALCGFLDFGKRVQI